MNAITQEVGGEILDPERHQVRRFVVDGRIQTKFEGGVGGFTTEHIEGVAADEFHRGGGEPHVERIEVVKQIPVFVVDTAVGFIGDNQVEKAHVQLREAVHHAGIGGDVDARVLVDLVGFADDTARFAGQVLLEGIIRLNAQFLAIAKE